MASLHIFVCLLGMVVLCHSECFFQKLELKDLNNPPKGCVDMAGKHHDFGSNWVTNCMECSCTSDGMSCCSKILEGDVSDECVLVVNKETCTAKVVLKSDTTKECNPV